MGKSCSKSIKKIYLHPEEKLTDGNLYTTVAFPEILVAAVFFSREKEDNDSSSAKDFCASRKIKSGIMVSPLKNLFNSAKPIE